MNPELLDSVVKAVAQTLHTQTVEIDKGGAGADERAACLIAALRAYATVIEEVTIPEDHRGLLAQMTEHTTQTLRAALKGVQR